MTGESALMEVGLTVEDLMEDEVCSWEFLCRRALLFFDRVYYRSVVVANNRLSATSPEGVVQQHDLEIFWQVLLQMAMTPNIDVEDMRREFFDDGNVQQKVCWCEYVEAAFDVRGQSKEVSRFELVQRLCGSRLNGVGTLFGGLDLLNASRLGIFCKGKATSESAGGDM
jgi:hypothetical protein